MVTNSQAQHRQKATGKPKEQNDKAKQKPKGKGKPTRHMKLQVSCMQMEWSMIRQCAVIDLLTDFAKLKNHL